MIDFSTLLDPEKTTDILLGFAPKLVTAIAVLFVFWLVGRLTKPALRGVLHRANFHATLVRMIVDNIYGAGLMIVGVIMAAAQVGVNVTAALAGMGVIGIAVGFAAQDSFANMISGFLIFWDKPFNVGDFITVQEQYGRVVEITMRTTRIRTQQNTYVIIPNKHIIDAVVVNHTKHGAIRVDVPIGIAYKESIPAAREVMLEAMRALKGVASDPPPDVVTQSLGASSVDLLARVWIDEPRLERPTYYAVVEACKIALDEAGIQIPYHHLQLFVDDVDDRVWQKAAGFGAMVAAAGGGAAEA